MVRITRAELAKIGKGGKPKKKRRRSNYRFAEPGGVLSWPRSHPNCPVGCETFYALCAEHADILRRMRAHLETCEGGTNA